MANKKRTIIWIFVTSKWQSEAAKKINNAKSKENMDQTCSELVVMYSKEKL